MNTGFLHAVLLLFWSAKETWATPAPALQQEIIVAIKNQVDVAVHIYEGEQWIAKVPAGKFQRFSTTGDQLQVRPGGGGLTSSDLKQTMHQEMVSTDKGPVAVFTVVVSRKSPKQKRIPSKQKQASNDYGEGAGAPCLKGQRILAVYGGQMDGAHCQPQRRNCWRGATVESMHLDTLLVDWDNGDPHFREIPRAHAAMRQVLQLQVFWQGCDGDEYSPWPPSEQDLVPPIEVKEPSQTNPPSGRADKKNTVWDFLRSSPAANGIFHPHWTESPEVFKQIKSWLAKGRVVVIHRALVDELAEAAFSAAASDWFYRNSSYQTANEQESTITSLKDTDFRRISDGGSVKNDVCTHLAKKLGAASLESLDPAAYSDRIHRQPRGMVPAPVKKVFEAFDSPGFLELVEHLLGDLLSPDGSCASDPRAPPWDSDRMDVRWPRPRVLGVNGMLTRYGVGDFSTPHNDCAGRRLASFNLHLASANWDAGWGGGLIWCRPESRIPPAFNQLVLFSPGADSQHAVELVGAGAHAEGAHRVSITGWWETDQAYENNVPGGCEVDVPQDRKHPWCQLSPWCWCGRRPDKTHVNAFLHVRDGATSATRGFEKSGKKRKKKAVDKLSAEL